MHLLAAEAGYLIASDASEPVRSWLWDARTGDFANARTARSLFDRMILEHASRVYTTSSPTGDDLFIPTADDLPARRDLDQPAPSPTTTALGYL